jgi:UDP-N-acetylglucosamine--N-acetylmuramyl-(pentapeptide) pyrophosphoryl-undecaprenol N-acetylglucosamine transferase
MGLLGAMRGVASAFSALPASYAMLDRVAPSAVLTVGGYAAGPISLAARTRGIPLALLEPNAVMGFANRAIAPWVSRAYTSFEAVERHFASGIVCRSGVPIREGFSPSPWNRSSEALRVLVLGGSQGARSLNESVPLALADHRARILVKHQCGKSDLQLVQSRYADAGVVDANVIPFIENMSSALAEADLVISRSGASAVSEICAVGRASILVPYPFAAGNHQQRNAESLSRLGAACWIHNRDATPAAISRLVRAFLEGELSLVDMSERARSVGRPEAASHIAADLLTLAGIGLEASQRAPAVAAPTGSSKESN